MCGFPSSRWHTSLLASQDGSSILLYHTFRVLWVATERNMLPPHPLLKNVLFFSDLIFQQILLLEVLTILNCNLFLPVWLSQQARETEESVVKLIPVVVSAWQNDNCFSDLCDLFPHFVLLNFLLVETLTSVYLCSPEMPGYPGKGITCFQFFLRQGIH